MPGVAFVSCPGDEALALASLPNAGLIRIHQVDTWDDYCGELLGLAQKPKTENFQTLCIDTGTFAYELAVEKTKSEQTRKTVVSQATWTEANRKFLEVLDNAKRHNYTTGKNLILLCHSRNVNIGTDENPLFETRMDLGDSLRSKVAGRFSTIFHLRMIGTNKRELVMKATVNIEVGSRLKFESNMENPTGPKILEAIDTYKKKVEKDNG